jgi:hypothetical protein
MTSPCQLLLEKLESSQRLQSYVRTFRLEKGYKYFPYDLTEEHKESMAVILALIDQLPNLSVFELDNTPYLADWIIYLATRPSLRLSIIITDCRRVDEIKAVAQLPYTATSLVTRRSFHLPMDDLIQAPLKRLELPHIPIKSLVDCHIKCGSPVLPSLQALELSNFENEVVGLLKCTPNLVELKFAIRLLRADPNFKDLKGVVSKLESFMGSRKILPYFTDGRPVNSVRTWTGPTDGPVPFFAKQLGSTVSIRALQWSIFSDIEDHINYIVTNCFHVQELRIVFDMIIDEVSVFRLSKIKLYIITSYRYMWPLVFIN